MKYTLFLLLAFALSDLTGQSKQLIQESDTSLYVTVHEVDYHFDKDGSDALSTLQKAREYLVVYTESISTERDEYKRLITQTKEKERACVRQLRQIDKALLLVESQGIEAVISGTTENIIETLCEDLKCKKGYRRKVILEEGESSCTCVKRKKKEK